jgi:hypothetical protein
MAYTIPETIRSSATAGERLLFRTLQTYLPDDYIVYYNKFKYYITRKRFHIQKYLFYIESNEPINKISLARLSERLNTNKFLIIG